MKRRAVLVGAGDNLARLHASLGPGRGGVEYDFLGAIAPSQPAVELPFLGEPWTTCRACSRRTTLDELIVTDSDLDAEQLLRLERRGASRAA